jgi:glycosyltransferase involved in cell wall biosynthesis
MFENTILVVGPQPPPIGGATISVRVLLDELEKYDSIRVLTINTSPKNQQKKTRLMSPEIQRRTVRIVLESFKNVRKSDAVLVFATHSFMFTMGCLLLFLAKLHHVPLYFKPLGAELGRYLKNQRQPARAVMLMILRFVAGILAQTRHLQRDLEQLGCANTYYIPGYRSATTRGPRQNRDADKFRLIFLSQIERGKGPLLLLKALQIAKNEHNLGVDCDFYGPILGEDREAFLSLLQSTAGAKYCGIVQAGTACQTMQEYDALVFPTYYATEGHPGVIVEAMLSGIPVIVTRFESVDELVVHGKNGLVVPIGDAHALALAIKRIAEDAALRENLGRMNYQMGQEFRSDRTAARMVEIMFRKKPAPRLLKRVS